VTFVGRQRMAGEPTEIDYLNGEVVRLADSLDRPAPINRKLVDRIREAETTRRAWSGSDLLRDLSSQPRGGR
jgi:2-dehydropantoate 2-reductase